MNEQSNNFPSAFKQKQDKLTKWFDQIRRTINQFSIFEKTVFFILCATMTISSLALLHNLNNLFVVKAPLPGGSIHEGIIGSARFINPVLVNSDSDRDLTALVYSGLTRAMPNGQIIPDLAESFTVSDDGKTYTFIIRPDAKFHDGKSVTALDVEFTIQKIQDPLIKSPRRANWNSVVIEIIDTHQIKFHLKTPYAPFLENTSIGILPKHMWKDLTPEQFPFSQFNAKPVGSGPYKFESVQNDASGLPQTYTLSAYKDFALGRPFIDTILISFFPNEDELIKAYEDKQIDNIHSISPEKLAFIKRPDRNKQTSPLPRIFGIFFNQNQATLFIDQKVREALNVALDKEKIVDEALGGFGVVINSPLLLEMESGDKNQDQLSEEERIKKAQDILASGGWIFNEEKKVLEKKISKSAKISETQTLAFSLSTGNIPELKKTANLVKDTWEKLGAKVDVNIFESGDLNQSVIRPRKYDALLFGEIIGRDLDYFAFWHSSQRNDPGLNIANYTNIKIDKMLEEARLIVSREERIARYQEFATELMKEVPAIFLFSPEFIYLTNADINNMELKNITVPSDRFNNIYKWYIETEKVWKFLIKN